MVWITPNYTYVYDFETKVYTHGELTPLVTTKAGKNYKDASTIRARVKGFFDDVGLKVHIKLK